MDYCGESLFVGRKNGRIQRIMPQQQIIHILTQLIHAVKYLHHRKIVHADIKLQNILYFQGIVKLCDFGYAHIAKQKQYQHVYTNGYGEHKQNNQIGLGGNGEIKDIVGTLEYLDPQYIQGRHSEYQRDIWAIGVVAYQLLVGKNPLQDMSENQKWSTVLRIKQIDVKNLGISKQMQQLLSMTLCPIQHRATITDIANLPIFNRHEDTHKKLKLDQHQSHIFD